MKSKNSLKINIANDENSNNINNKQQIQSSIQPQTQIQLQQSQQLSNTSSHKLTKLSSSSTNSNNNNNKQPKKLLYKQLKAQKINPNRYQIPNHPHSPTNRRKMNQSRPEKVDVIKRSNKNILPFDNEKVLQNLVKLSSNT